MQRKMGRRGGVKVVVLVMVVLIVVVTVMVVVVVVVATGDGGDGGGGGSGGGSISGGSNSSSSTSSSSAYGMKVKCEKQNFPCTLACEVSRVIAPGPGRKGVFICTLAALHPGRGLW